MQTTVTEHADSRVLVEAAVPGEDVDRAVQRAARSMARDLRLPGFRKGKAPPSLVIQRVGLAAVLEDAIREALPEWYEKAVLSSGISPIGDPAIEIVSPPSAQGEPFTFKFEVGVRPKAKLGEYKGLEVGRDQPGIPDDIVDREIERIREGFARLEQVDRPASDGDVLLVDFEGLVDGKAFEGGKANDYLLELGGGQLVDGFEEQLAGVSAGDAREVKVRFPDDYHAEGLAGEDAVFNVEVKEVREKVLPDLDDDFAAEASEFDTLDELRTDIRTRVSEVMERQAEQDFRVAAVDAAAANATVELPDDLVTARAEERWSRVERQLAARGMNADAYLNMQGKSRDDVIAESKQDVQQELKRESVLAAIVEAEGIEATEEEMVEELAHTAEHERTTPEKLLQRLRDSGRDAMVREDIQIRKAIDVVVDASKPIPKEQAEAREKIWTPDKEESSEEPGGPAGGTADPSKSLWTPGGDS